LSRFEELATKNQMTALHYLQTTLSEIIDHNDPEQTKEVSFKCYILIWYISVYFIHMLGRVRHIQMD
jgi:hypothetical protein